MSRSVLINYATPEFRISQARNRKTALEIGQLDRVISYTPRSIGRAFRRANREILSHPRGGGYWLWKPYLILKTLKRMSPGDVLFYCDSGSFFIESARPLLEIARVKQAVVPFSVGLPEIEWTKRDALILLDADAPQYLDTPQRLASFSLYRVSPEAISFASRYLEHCTDPRIVTDQPNTLGEPDHPPFRENRHDQSVFSLLTKKAGYPCYRDPSRPPGSYSDCAESPYPRIIELTRKRHYLEPGWPTRISRKILHRIRGQLTKSNH